MRKLYFKGMLFCGMVVLLCVGVVLLSTREPYRTAIAKWTACEDFTDENGLISAFEGARWQDGTTVLLIGDSICSQLYADVGPLNPDVSILSRNAALLVTGQYLLAREYLENHPDATDVFLVMHPLALTRVFDTTWGYRYAAMTYVETDTLRYLDADTREAMTKLYGGFFLRKGVVALAEDSPICRKLALGYVIRQERIFGQEGSFALADQYIRKLYELCGERNVTLHVYAAPATEYYREQIEALEKEYADSWMSGVYPDYFRNLWFYPDAWSEDLSHFSGEYAESGHLHEVIREAYDGTMLAERIRIE